MRRARASGLASVRRCWIGEEKIADVVLGAMVLQGALRERFGLDSITPAKLLSLRVRTVDHAVLHVTVRFPSAAEVITAPLGAL